MEVGKISETILKRSIFKQIGHRRREILARPGVGEDCAVVEFGPDEVAVLSTDPITGTVNEIGTLAVHITANDIASGGAELIGILLTVILPEGTEESQLKEMVQDVERACESLNIEIMGGHTEVSLAVNQPIITVTGVGKAKKDEVVLTKGLKPGQDLVMTKWAGVEGTAILAKDREEVLGKRYDREWIQQAKEFINYISVVKDAGIAKKVGVSTMHDVTEGGIFGALWEIASASGVGVTVDLKKIPIRQETIEICEFFDISPYMLISSGCLLIGTDQGEKMVLALKEAGIHAAVIGTATQGKDKIVLNGSETRYLEPPKSDELYKALNRP